MHMVHISTLVSRDIMIPSLSLSLHINRGINVVKYNPITKKHSLLLSAKPNAELKQGEDFTYNSTEVATDLLVNLNAKPADVESYSLTQIKPGIVIEERYTQPGDDDVMPAFEFNVFTVWGRVLFANCKTGYVLLYYSNIL